MTIDAEVACVWNAAAVLGEGPTWNSRNNKLYWIDIKGERLHCFDPKFGTRKTWHTPQRIFSLDSAPANWRAPERAQALWFIGCTASGFGWIGLTENEILFEQLAHPENKNPGNRYNDGKVGPDGRYWAGSMDDAEQQASGSLYAFSSDGAVACVDTDYLVTNGPAFSPDGRTLYHNDSARRRIYAFDLDATGASRRRIFKEFGDADGYPDGMTTDKHGNIWVAMWDGACVRKLSSGGADLGRIEIPATRTTSCTFADRDSKVMFVTSACVGLTTPKATDGGLFRVDFR